MYGAYSIDTLAWKLGERITLTILFHQPTKQTDMNRLKLRLRDYLYMASIATLLLAVYINPEVFYSWRIIPSVAILVLYPSALDWFVTFLNDTGEED